MRFTSWIVPAAWATATIGCQESPPTAPAATEAPIPIDGAWAIGEIRWETTARGGFEQVLLTGGRYLYFRGTEEMVVLRQDHLLRRDHVVPVTIEDGELTLGPDRYRLDRRGEEIEISRGDFSVTLAHAPDGPAPEEWIRPLVVTRTDVSPVDDGVDIASWGGDRIWFGNQTPGGSVDAYDSETLELLQTMDIGPSAGGIALVNPTTLLLGSSSGRIHAFDITTGEPGEPGVETGPWVRGIAYHEGRLWCLSWNESRLYQLTPSRNAILAEFETGHQPSGIGGFGADLFITSFGVLNQVRTLLVDGEAALSVVGAWRIPDEYIVGVTRVGDELCVHSSTQEGYFLHRVELGW